MPSNGDGHLTIDVNRVPIAGSIDREMPGGSTLTLLVDQLASDDEQLLITQINGPEWVTLVTGGDGGTLDGTALTAAPPAAVAADTYSFP